MAMAGKMTILQVVLVVFIVSMMIYNPLYLMSLIVHLSAFY